MLLRVALRDSYFIGGFPRELCHKCVLATLPKFFRIAAFLLKIYWDNCFSFCQKLLYLYFLFIFRLLYLFLYVPHLLIKIVSHGFEIIKKLDIKILNLLAPSNQKIIIIIKIIIKKS